MVRESLMGMMKQLVQEKVHVSCLMFSELEIVLTIIYILYHHSKFVSFVFRVSRETRPLAKNRKIVWPTTSSSMPQLSLFAGRKSLEVWKGRILWVFEYWYW